MPLPNAERAVVDLVKLRGYCLNEEHPRGRHKARAFAAALGLTAADAVHLRDALLDAARVDVAEPTTRDQHGQQYRVDFGLETAVGQVTVRSYGIVRAAEDFPGSSPALSCEVCRCPNSSSCSMSWP